ncbi:MAG: ABC transporter substrate-binding protein [Syntrophobacterales bacterium]|nr:MAG: ABC transporter substrate-binding protein [Syntrophobacterales bacterium]
MKGGDKRRDWKDNGVILYVSKKRKEMMSMIRVNKILCISLLVCLVVVGVASMGAGEEKRILRYTQAFPTAIDPAVGGDYSSTRALTILYDTLVYPDKTGAPQSHVAESWEVSPDGKTWTFHLRSGVKFHNGDELTAEDVAFSMERLVTIGEGWAFLFTGLVERTELVDKYRVRFSLKNPFGPFLTILYKFYIANKDIIVANIKKPGAYGDFGDYGRDYLLTHDVGSGPYMVKEFSVGEYLLMERFPKYWGYVASNAPDEVKQIGTTESVTIKTMMSRQELEISDQWQSLESLRSLDRLEGVDIARLGLGGVFHYMINTRKPPTDDIHFRKAIAFATDYKTLVTQILPGYKQGWGPVSASVPGHDPKVFQYSFDLDKAREELKKSKYYAQLDKYPVELHWVGEVPSEEKVALLLQASLAKIGVTAKVVKDPWLSVVEYMAKEDTSPHTIPMFLPSDFPEAGALLKSRYHSVSAHTFTQNEWLRDTKYDKMIEEALATVDRGERFAKYVKLQHYIADLCPTLFLADDLSQHAYQTTYMDWPAARGEGIPIIGYELDARWIQIYPEKKAR